MKLEKYEAQLAALKSLVDLLTKEIAARDELLEEIRKLRADRIAEHPGPSLVGFCNFISHTQENGRVIADAIRSAEKMRFDIHNRRLDVYVNGMTAAALRVFAPQIKQALSSYFDTDKRVYFRVRQIDERG